MQQACSMLIELCSECPQYDSICTPHLWVLHALAVGLRVAQGLDVHVVGQLDVLGRAALDKDGLAAPLDGDRLPRLDLRQVHLQARHGQDVLGRLHAPEQAASTKAALPLLSSRSPSHVAHLHALTSQPRVHALHCMSPLPDMPSPA